MIVWLGDWGAPEKIHPNLEPGWVGFGWTFPARNELICTSFETDELDENMFQKRCAFVLLPNMLWYLLWYLSYMLCFYQGTQKIPPLRRWWTDKGCFWAENSKSQQRICCKHPTSSRAYGSMISTSQIQSSQAFYGFFTSGYHLHGAASDFGGSTSICPLFGSLALQTPATAHESLNVRGWSASSFPCLMASLLTCTTALRAHWWLVRTEKWRGSFHHLLYASVKNKQSSHLQRNQTQAMTFADIQFKTLKSPRAPCLPSSLSFGRRPQLSKLAKGMRRRTSLMEVWQSFYGRFQ